MTLETEDALSSLQDCSVCIPAGGVAAGVVLFAQGTRQNHHSQDMAAAKIFNKHKLTTLLPDLPPPEENDRADILRLAEQLEYMTLRVHQNPERTGLRPGYFASGDSAEAALVAAARHPDLVKAVVIRGGRPDRVQEFLPLIKIPVLLIAAGRDPGCVRSNRRALEKLNGHSTLNVIPSASQAFEEPGVMEESAQLAALWFLQHLE